MFETLQIIAIVLHLHRRCSTDKPLLIQHFARSSVPISDKERICVSFNGIRLGFEIVVRS